MVLDNIMLSETSQKHTLCDITYKWNLEIKLTNVYSKTNRFTNSENRLVITMRRGNEGGTGERYRLRDTNYYVYNR